VIVNKVHGHLRSRIVGIRKIGRDEGISNPPVYLADISNIGVVDIEHLGATRVYNPVEVVRGKKMPLVRLSGKLTYCLPPMVIIIDALTIIWNSLKSMMSYRRIPGLLQPRLSQRGQKVAVAQLHLVEYIKWHIVDIGVFYSPYAISLVICERAAAATRAFIMDVIDCIEKRLGKRSKIYLCQA